MLRIRQALFLILGFGVVPGAGDASAASDRAATAGVALRLVAGHPDEDGRFRAALLVDLEPGWKTYWLDPGEAGIPPSLDFSGSPGVEGVTARFPAPHRFDDGFSTSIVYSEPFAVALEGHAGKAGGRLDLRLTLGVCREICIPASAELSAAMEAAGAEPDVVASSFAALPEPSTPARGIVGAALSADGTSLAVTVRPAGAAERADLFVAAPGGWFFGAPVAVTVGGDAATMTLPVTAKPRRNGGTPTLDAVLVGPGGTWRADGLPVAPPGKG